MAQLRKCENGHYWDPDMYPGGCPYCSNLSGPVSGGFVSRDISELGDVTRPPEGFIFSEKTESPDKTEPASVQPRTVDEESVTRPSPLAHGIREVKGAPETSRSVTGWLVAVDGKYKGRSFPLHNGYNYIGRRESNDVALTLDEQISGDKQASVAYDARNNKFRVAAGQSTNITYVNGEPLYAGESKPLEAYDAIEVGTSKLLFVPFCSEKFVWTEE